MKGGDDAEQRADGGRRHDGKGGDAQVEADIVEPRQVFRRQRQQPIDAPIRQEEAEQSAAQGEHQALDQQLPHQSGRVPRRARCGPPTRGAAPCRAPAGGRRHWRIRSAGRSPRRQTGRGSPCGHRPRASPGRARRRSRCSCRGCARRSLIAFRSSFAWAVVTLRAQPRDRLEVVNVARRREDRPRSAAGRSGSRAARASTTSTSCGWTKNAGITPTTTVGTPFSRIVGPRPPCRPPRCVRQTSSAITAMRGAGRRVAAFGVRPAEQAGLPKTSKKPPVVSIAVEAHGLARAGQIDDVLPIAGHCREASAVAFVIEVVRRPRTRRARAASVRCAHEADDGDGSG